MLSGVPECDTLDTMFKIAAALCLPLAAFAQTARPVPVDNAYVHVIDALDQPHSKGRMHQHKVNRVMIYLTKCDTRLTYADGKVENQHWKPNDVAWSPAGEPHTSENPNDAACHIIEIELKPGEGRKPVPAGPLDPVKVDPKRYQVLLDNAQVRVLRATYAPHDTGVLHQHDRDRVTVYLTDSELRITGADGKVETRRTQRGQAGWGGVAKHQEQNVSATPFEVIAVELKDR